VWLALTVFVWLYSFLLWSQALADVAPRYVLQMFTEAEMLVNITEHKVNVYICITTVCFNMFVLSAVE